MSIFDKVSKDVLELTKTLIDRKFYDVGKENLRYAVEHINLIPRYRLNIIEFAIASLSYPTWCTYHCLISAADAFNVRTRDLARHIFLARERYESKEFISYIKKLTDLRDEEISSQISFLLYAVQFMNTTVDQSCYEHCHRKCEREYSECSEAYHKCMLDCLNKERC